MKNRVLWTCCVVIGLMIAVHYPCFAEEINRPQDNISASDLIGSTWRLVYDNPRFGHRDYSLIFLENGKLINTHPNERTPDNDTWEINGRTAVLKFNNAYAVYTGQFSDRDHMSGSATSKTGGKWQWNSYRVKKAE
jgi:hypothetical protein